MLLTIKNPMVIIAIMLVIGIILMLLGIAIDRVKFLTPRYFWNALPGGIPYFGIIDKEQEENT